MDNLSDAEFKTLVIGMLTEMIEYSSKIKEVKAMKSEIKKNIQGTNSDEKETRNQIKYLGKNVEIHINHNRMKKQEFKKVRRSLGNSGTSLNISTSESLGCQKEKRKSNKLKTYLKK